MRGCRLFAFGVCLIVAGGCGSREAAPPPESYRPTATVKDIMDSIVDPESDVLWNAVATVISADGIEERAPQTEEEWAEIRKSAVQLVEATNLLRIPGRKVAKPGEKSQNPRIELEPAAIEKLIADDPETWTKLINGLHDAALPALKAIDARNVQGLFDAGDHMEKACESCHQHYWYPPNSAAAWKINEVELKNTEAAAPQSAKRGAIKGHVRLNGKAPGNPVIRMGMDPMCVQANAGKRQVQDVVAAGADGGLANVFVRLQGSFPPSPVPAEPVTIDQRGCIYTPRVVGARVGQTLLVKNSDAGLHNVHSVSMRANGFNASQPKGGMVQQFKLNEEEIMLRVMCDVHRWMTSFVGVVSHPYFATSGQDGAFVIENVPPGTYTIRAWHELYGDTSQTVRVLEGGTSNVEFAYTAK